MLQDFPQGDEKVMDNEQMLVLPRHGTNSRRGKDAKSRERTNEFADLIYRCLGEGLLTGSVGDPPLPKRFHSGKPQPSLGGDVSKAV